ncbi:MAG TPA: urease accessory protein UreD, partial [Terriglobia bacterium]|nr:urease accessory protein UreD [Terriglobia bacterium]
DLTFAACGGRTILRDSYCEVPFKITRLMESLQDSTAHLILMHSTAGVFGGDELECSIHIKSGAYVRITQQSATKIHPSGGRLARQINRIKVETGASLCLELEPIIPFAESRFSQTTQIDLVQGAQLAYWECMMSGRIGRNEQWKFDELASESRVSMDGRLLFLDRYSIVPAKVVPATNWAMGQSGYYGTGLYCGDRADALAEELHERMPGAGIDLPAPGFTVVRVVAANGPDFHRYRKTWSCQTSRTA